MLPALSISGTVSSPTQCSRDLPLSRLYYPLVLTLLDLSKPNIYAAWEMVRCGRRAEAVVVLLDICAIFIYVFVSGIQFLLFAGRCLFLGIPFLVYDCSCSEFYMQSVRVIDLDE